LRECKLICVACDEEISRKLLQQRNVQNVRASHPNLRARSSAELMAVSKRQLHVNIHSLKRPPGVQTSEHANQSLGSVRGESSKAQLTKCVGCFKGQPSGRYPIITEVSVERTSRDDVTHISGI